MMLNFPGLDIDRLHRVIEHGGGRNCGKTYALMMQIIGYIQLGEFDTIAIGCRDHLHIRNFMRDFQWLLHEHDIRVIDGSHRARFDLWICTCWDEEDGGWIHETKLVFTPAIYQHELGRGWGAYLYMEDHYASLRSDRT